VGNVTYSETIPLNQWTHIAYSWGSEGAKLYINHKLAGTNETGTDALNTSTVLYGIHDILGDYGVKGYTDEFRVSNIQRDFEDYAFCCGDDGSLDSSYYNGTVICKSGTACGGNALGTIVDVSGDGFGDDDDVCSCSAPYNGKKCDTDGDSIANGCCQGDVCEPVCVDGNSASFTNEWQSLEMGGTCGGGNDWLIRDEEDASNEKILDLSDNIEYIFAQNSSDYMFFRIDMGKDYTFWNTTIYMDYGADDDISASSDRIISVNKERNQVTVMDGLHSLKGTYTNDASQTNYTAHYASSKSIEFMIPVSSLGVTPPSIDELCFYAGINLGKTVSFNNVRTVTWGERIETIN